MTENASLQQEPVAAQALAASHWHWSPWVIWLIPITAALIGGWIVMQTLLARGPTITISFKNAEGIEAGKTKIKFKEVDIGDVKAISLSKDRSEVIVTAKLAKGTDSFLREDTRFWVVRPRVGIGGVSGLGTLFSGSYIGVDAGKSDEDRDNFKGLDSPPFISTGLPGRQFVLQGDQIGSLDVGAPIYHRHIQVGQVIAYELDKNGRGITLKIFVDAPYDRYVAVNTLFWHERGVEISLDANGVKVQTESLVSIVSGGISFETPVDALPEATAPVNARFKLFVNRDKAQKHPDTEVRKVLLYFNETVRGLAPGAPVDFRGIVIGEVETVSLEYDNIAKIYRFPVEVNIFPDRLRKHYRKGSKRPPTGQEDSRRVIDGLVERGLRAQLKTGNLLTGMLYVALDFFPDASRARLDWKKEPLVLPTVPGALEELQVTLMKIAHKLDKLPLDGISGDLRVALASLDATLKSTDKLVLGLHAEVSPKATQTLEQVRKTLAGAERTLSEDAPLQQDIRDALREISRAAQALRSVADTFERHPESLIRGNKEDAK